MSTPTESINAAFAADTKLRKRIFDAIDETPQHAPLFEDIAKYHLAGQQFSVTSNTKDEPAEQPLKKRKLEDGAAAVNGSQPDQPRIVILAARELSFTLPQRKKLHLSIVQYGKDMKASTTTFSLCGRNPANGQVEFEYPISSFAYAMRVPIPEKAQKQYNFCFLPAQPQGPSITAGASENIIWTVNHGPLKSCQVLSEELAELAGSEDILENALDAVLRRNNNKLVYPTEAEFASALVESHRKNDKAYHVKAFRGSKDGFLFFLENGIFFGFKKPLAFFPFHEIESVSYMAVLQRTFNLVIVTRGMNETEQQEVEFSMLDQADFAGIDAYIKKHQLQDASMAEARRAKQYKVNGVKGQATTEEGDDGQTELRKAEQELEDEEDEMEEDYDPGSDGESEGSGSSDDDEDYDDSRIVKGKDLVQDELGSEAEDVEVTDEEDAGDEEEEEAEEEEVEEEAEVEVEQVEALLRPQKAPAPSLVHSKPPPPKGHAIKPGPGVPDFDDEDQL